MNRSSSLPLSVLFILALSISVIAQGYASSSRGKVVAAPSNRADGPGAMHTSLLVFIPERNAIPAIPAGETPSSIGCIYGVTAPPPLIGPCLQDGNVVPSGGSRAIVVVVYGHYPAMQSDLNAFSAQWGLPTQTIQVICSPVFGSCPNNVGTGWDLQTALDVEWAHAMAPNAQIIVSEWTNTNGALTDGAETAAGEEVAAFGGGEVSNSWTYSGGEFATELALDTYFAVPGVVYLAEAGDLGLGPQYPSVSPNVISVGGTTINRFNNGDFNNETCWSLSGGGISIYEPLPSYQTNPNPAFPYWNIPTTNLRSTPDLSADADPASGVAVYASLSPLCLGWCTVGGTGAATPILAGLVNEAGSFSMSTNQELTKVYNNYMKIAAYGTFFNDIKAGNNGAPAVAGWDPCTGIGSTAQPTAY